MSQIIAERFEAINYTLNICASVRINGNREHTGYLHGVDPFINIVIDETTEHCKDGNKKCIGMMVD